MFFQYFSIFAKSQSQKRSQKKFENFYCFFLLRMTQKFSIFFSPKITKSPKVGTVLGPFGPKKGQRDFFSEKSDSATFYPL